MKEGERKMDLVNLYKDIDKKAEAVAKQYCEKKNITFDILKTITDLYKQEEEIKSVFKDESFEIAYHEPITSKLEFFLARIFYYISSNKGEEWKIYLRRQRNRCAPDIRIEKNGKTIIIVEVKAKAGWMQSFISPEAYIRDEKNNKQPKEFVEKYKEQLKKYKKEFETDNIYMLLPTLASVHKKTYKTKYEGYKENYRKNTEFPKDKFVILSKDLNLNLAKKNIKENEIKKDELTDEFEKMLNKTFIG
jgi:hypothetical protein